MDIVDYEFLKKIDQKRIPSTSLPGTPLNRNSGQATDREIRGYQKRLGKLNYTRVITRPDIAQGVSKLSKFLQSPSKEHVEDTEHIMQYLVETKDKGIENDEGAIQMSRTFVASSDATFADDLETTSSSIGFSFQILE